MKGNVVLDSSIWIELERNDKEIIRKILPLIKSNKVCLVDLIITEVLRGTRTEKDFKMLKESFADFDTFSTNWINVANLAFHVSTKGFQPPLTDLYIAQCVIENKLALYTQDKNFLSIRKVKQFKLQML